MTEAHTEKEGSSAMDMPRVSDTMLHPSTIEFNIIADQGMMAGLMGHMSLHCLLG